VCFLTMEVGKKGPAEDTTRLSVFYFCVQIVLKQPILQRRRVTLPLISHRSLCRSCFRTQSNKSVPDGWILVALTNRTTPSSQGLSTPCFAGIVMRLNVTYICQMFQQMTTIKTTCPPSRGKRLFGKADGLPGAGHYKSLLLRHWLNSSP
jgi:hypothetical protein